MEDEGKDEEEEEGEDEEEADSDEEAEEEGTDAGVGSGGGEDEKGGALVAIGEPCISVALIHLPPGMLTQQHLEYSCSC